MAQTYLNRLVFTNGLETFHMGNGKIVTPNSCMHVHAKVENMLPRSGEGNIVHLATIIT
jgi:hypothetical protein